jgi:hypothetical protein
MRIRSSRYLTRTSLIYSQPISRYLTTSTFWKSLEDESQPVQINGTCSNQPTYFRTSIWVPKAWRLDSNMLLSLNLFHFQRNIEKELQIVRTESIQVLIEGPNHRSPVKLFAVLEFRRSLAIGRLQSDAPRSCPYGWHLDESYCTCICKLLRPLDLDLH